MRIVDFFPDWSHNWTVAEAERELRDFKFIGPGWYVTKTDVLLVAPLDEVERTGSIKGDLEKDPWRQRWPEDARFSFNVYSGRSPFDALNALANAPTRIDER